MGKNNKGIIVTGGTFEGKNIIVGKGAKLNININENKSNELPKRNENKEFLNDLKDLIAKGEIEEIIENLVTHFRKDDSTINLDVDKDLKKSIVNKLNDRTTNNPYQKNKIDFILEQLAHSKEIETLSFDVFISYKTQDYDLASHIYNLLKQNGHSPFLSKESLPLTGNAEYMDAIYNAIEESKHFILVSSNPKYINSKWVKAEWMAFINEKLSNRKTGNMLTITDGLFIHELPLPLRQFEVFDFSTIDYEILSKYIK